MEVELNDNNFGSTVVAYPKENNSILIIPDQTVFTVSRVF